MIKKRPVSIFARNLWLYGLILLPIVSAPAQVIRAYAILPNYTPVVGDSITITIDVDMSATTELLGAFNARLDWNPDSLSFIRTMGAVTPGFDNPIVNEQQVAGGVLQFANFNAVGGGGLINILKLSYRVQQAPDTSLGLQLAFTEMKAAQTFIDLLPFLQIIVTAVAERQSQTMIPGQHVLHQNYPNPFNAGTRITFDLPKAGEVEVAIYNLTGIKTRALLRTRLAAGRHYLTWDGKDENGQTVPTGIYFYRLRAGGIQAQKHMLFVK